MSTTRSEESIELESMMVQTLYRAGKISWPNPGVLVYTAHSETALLKRRFTRAFRAKRQGFIHVPRVIPFILRGPYYFLPFERKAAKKCTKRGTNNHEM